MRRSGSSSFVWPLALLAIGAVMIGLAQGLARLDGFRLYGLVQALGEIVGVIGIVWLVAVSIKALVQTAKRS